MTMAMSMPPPSLGGFSLRVQLFSPNAHALSDKPIRAFRVVISPDVTIREFCQEASRIHEINYGEPIAIKKCQDDQEFDVTQSEVVGVLFANTATIRVVQSTATPSVRDSVPPDSALRYDPGINISRKREREGSVQPNGALLSNGWKSNKRRRVSDLDPDQPIPSRELDFEAGSAVQQSRGESASDSHRSNLFGRSNGSSRDVRAVIQETPPPEPRQNSSTDQQHLKSSHSNMYTESRILPPSRPHPSNEARAASNPPRAKSASYHIERATERGTSVSTAATSPLSADQQTVHNEVRFFTNRKVSDPITNGKAASRSPNRDSIYDVIESDSEGPAAILKKTKASLKIRNSPQNGLPGLEWASKFNTPPNGSRRNSRSHDSPSELPLTPRSSTREREERQRQRREAEETKDAHKAAAEAAKQRQREADQAREAEEARRTEQERIRKEDEERDAREKRAAIIAKATRIEKERVEKVEKDRKIEEERKLKESRQEQAKLKKEREQAARLEREKKATAEKERLEAERIEREKAEEVRKSKEKAEALKRKKSPSGAAELSDHSKASTPARETSVKPQSSTPFIPSGRKSALKPSSSPVLTRTSPSGSTKDVGSDSNSVNGLSKERRVSFDATVKPGDDTVPRHQTPIRPGALTPKPAIAAAPIPKTITPVLPPPSLASRFKERSSTPQRSTTLEHQNITPQRQTARLPAGQTPSSIQTAIRRTTPQVIIKSELSAASPSRKGEPSSTAATPKGKPKIVEPKVLVEISSDDDSDEDIPSRVQPKIDPVKLLNNTLRPQNPLITPISNPQPETVATPVEQDDESEEEVEGGDEDEDEDKDVEMASNDSSPRESRSPVIFNQTTAPPIPPPALLPAPAKPLDEEETQSDTDSSSEAEEEEKEEEEEEDNETSSDSQSESSSEGQEDEISKVQVPQSSPELPRSKQAIKPSVLPTTPKGTNHSQSQKQRKPALALPPRSPVSSDSGANTQEEVDFQLTSSLYEAVSHSSQARKSTPILPTTSSQSRGFTIGASLQSLNEKKPNLSSQPQSQSLVNGNGRTASQKKVEVVESDSDSSSEEESDSTSDSDSSEDEDIEAKNELAAAVAKIGSQSSSQGVNGRSASQSHSQSSRMAGKELKKKRKDDKYLTGYRFSQLR